MGLVDKILPQHNQNQFFLFILAHLIKKVMEDKNDNKSDSAMDIADAATAILFSLSFASFISAIMAFAFNEGFDKVLIRLLLFTISIGLGGVIYKLDKLIKK